jgi:dethiobiotin synthetase
MSFTELPERLFIAGTDTDVGKTVVSAILMAGKQAAYWKPVQSGTQETTDSEWIRRMTGLPDECFVPETYVLSQPLSPHAAAAIEGVCINLSAFSVPEKETYPRLIVEGAGGVMVPLNNDHFMIDLIRHLKLPVVLVARSALGTINHTLMSLCLLRKKKIPVVGVVMNGPPDKINKDAIETYGQIPVIAEVDRLSGFDLDGLQKAYIRYFTT